MNGSNMENEKTPLYVAFSTQKGGVGKTTFTVLAASYLYYLKGYDVAVVDCDYPQHSIAGMRKRDAEQVGADEDYKRMAYEQFTRLGKKAYPVLCSSPEKAIATADEHIIRCSLPLVGALLPAISFAMPLMASESTSSFRKSSSFMLS